MEKSNASLEDSPSKTESPASTSKPVVSLIQINSISIDICCPMEEIELPVQEHFSIRGFVSEVRKKNSKILSPFSSSEDSDASLDNLPPLSVPKFRWWQCSHCIPEMVVDNQNDIVGTSSHVDKMPLNIKKKGNLAEPIPFQNRQQPGNAEEYPSTRAGGSDTGSSGSSDGFVPLLTRRKKKLRSLADIMEEEKNSASGGYLVTGSASSNETHVTENREEFRNPHRKKRTAREEMLENLEASNPMGAAKRMKLHLEADKASRRVEISDSEAEAVALERLDLQVSAGVKHKKSKIFRKIEKQRQVDNDSRTVQPNDSELKNATGSEGLEKHLMASNSSASTLRVQSVPSYNGNIELSNSKFADAGIQEKITLDLSLSSCSDAERKLLDEKSLDLRDIPDLNESIIEKTATIQESQLPSVHEKIKNVTLTGTEANPVEGKRQTDISSQSREYTTDLGGSVDDIPMEIVELLAKNQQERALENSRQHSYPKEMITSSCGGSSAVYVDAVPAMINIPFSNMTNAASFSNPNTGFVQGVLNFPQGKYFHPEACSSGTSQFRLFTPLVPIQQYNAGYLDSHPIIPGLRTIDGADLLWQPLRKNMPFNGFPLHPLPDQFRKGKSICNKNSIKKTSSGPSSLGLLDAYSNVNIPAMQLLSLTNLRNVSGSPLIQHPSFNPTDTTNQLLVGTPFFPLSNQLPCLLNGATFSGESYNRSPLPAQIPAQKGCSRDIPTIEKHNPKQSPNDSTSQVCVLNRNPADFTILDACNEYTISARSLNFKKRNAAKLKLPPKVPKRKWVRRGYSRSDR